MSSNSSSKIKQPDIDRKLLIKELKGRIKELKRMSRSCVAIKVYGQAGEYSAMASAYEYLLDRVLRGIYNIYNIEPIKGKGNGPRS